MLLTVEDLTAGYGGAPVIHSVGLEVKEGEVVALLGSNGAGKTTTLLSIAGLLVRVSGGVELLGRSVVGLPPHQLARRGMAFVPDDRALLSSLTVRENLALVARPPVDPLELFPELARLRARQAGQLSGGEQQMLALARALCTRPKLLLIDEPSQGLAPLIARRLLAVLKDFSDQWGTGVLLVEQNVKAALEISGRGYVMQNGEIVLTSDASDLLNRRDVVESSYLGEIAAV